MKLVLFDRDGVVNKRIVGDYVKKWEEFEFSDGFFELFAFIKSLEYKTALVTNQQGIAKGVMSTHKLNNIHQLMQIDLYEKTDFEFDTIKFSPDLDNIENVRRKPGLGMFLEIIGEFRYENIDFENSYMIGDSLTDLVPAKVLGYKTIYIGDKEELFSQIENKSDKIYEIFKYNLNHFANNLYLRQVQKLSPFFINLNKNKFKTNLYNINYIFDSVSSLNSHKNEIFK